MPVPLLLRLCLALCLLTSLPAQAPLRVGTWNIQALGVPQSIEWNESIRTIQRIGADLLAVQEVTDAEANQWPAFATAAGYPHQALSTAGTALSGGLRLAVLSRLPIAFSRSHSAAALSGDPLANDIGRVIFEVRVTLPANQGILGLFVLHLKAGSTPTDDFRRAIEIRRLNQAVALFRTANPGMPYIVCGDLNDDLGDAPFGRTFSALPSGLPGSFRLGQDQTFPIIYDPFTAISAPAGTLAPATQEDSTSLFTTRPSSGRRLDYLILHGPIQNDGDEVWNSARDNGIDDPPAGQWLPKTGAVLPTGTSGLTSDHFPVFADLRVGNPPPPPPPALAYPQEIIIDELMATPLASLDPLGEWIELRNTGPRTLNLLGYELQSPPQERVILPALTLPPRGRLLLGANAFPTLNGGITPAFAWPPGSLTLSPPADRIELRAPDQSLIDAVDLTTSTPGFALERINPLCQGLSTNFQPAAMPYGAGDRGTPGQLNPTSIPLLSTTLTGPAAIDPGTTTLTLTAPLALANKPYLLAAALSAHPPLILPPCGHTIPLAQDDLFTLSTTPNNGFFDQFTGTTNLFGFASPRLQVPSLPALAGFRFLLSGVVLDPAAPAGIASLIDPLPITLR